MAKKHLTKAKNGVLAATKKFKAELKKAMVTAITAAFGFLIALSWKDLITKFVSKLSSYSPLQGQLVSTFIVTIISVLGIILATKIFSKKEVEEVKK